MSKVFFISDTHFSHRNILTYEPIRKDIFGVETVEQMDEKIIKNWNSTVSNDDLVWFLGDFAMGSRNHVVELGHKLNGHKYMIKGNHDIYPDQVYFDAGFERVSRYPVILKKKFILSHAPMDDIDTGSFINIFGHVHSKGNYEDKKDHFICVCIERTDGKPITLPIFDHAAAAPYYDRTATKENNK